jgi:small subunit ribosomal protein S4
MSRFTGPRLKKVRALGVSLPGLTRKVSERRPYPPGQHGQARRKLSDYAVRLREKQKLRFNYGLTERQLRILVDEARHLPGVTGEVILELLERRLDNVVWRAGFAATIPAARQLVSHGHVRVNGRRLDIPSVRLSPGDTVSLRDGSRENAHVKDSLSAAESVRPAWLTWDEPARAATMRALPDPASVLLEVNTQHVVEFYSRSL